LERSANTTITRFRQFSLTRRRGGKTTSSGPNSDIGGSTLTKLDNTGTASHDDTTSNSIRSEDEKPKSEHKERRPTSNF